MWAYLSRAVPWLHVGISCALLAGLLGAVRYDPWTLWPLQGVAVGLLAGATGWCLDEAAAAVVDQLPRGLRWQVSARGLGIGVLVAAWSAGVWWSRGSLFTHAWSVWLQGVAAVAVTLAWVTWRRSGGEAAPGQRWALGAVSAATAWALVHPARDRVPVFPYAPYGEGDWTVSSIGWGLAGAAALAVLVGILADLRWWGVRAPRAEGPVNRRPAGPGG